jgi:steroid delta-isomerase-like uncharacterized protein
VDDDVTAEDEMVRVAEELFEAFNAHDIPRILSHMTDDVVWRTPEKTVHGKVAAEADVRETMAAFSDIAFARNAFEVFSNTQAPSVVTPWVATGKMTGPASGLPATGRSARIEGMTVARFRGAQISEYRILYDQLDFMQQIGALPTTDSVAFKAIVLGDVMVGKAMSAVRRR